MPFPRGDEYQSVIQNPRMCFLDPELQSCQVETTQLGLPKPYTGSFTTTYHLYNNSSHWAVRCFTRQVTDLQQRYRAIGRFIARKPDPYFVEANCLLKGIKINGLWIPVIKMKWVDGYPLNTYIELNLTSPEKIGAIANSFYSMVQRLDSLGVAHGDLQHGNILINKDQLFLIDYDGMVLPELVRLGSNEIGHPNYQHPLRNEGDSNKTIDRFSTIVIYLGLVALESKPQMWDKYNQGENILFRKNDFLNPGGSELLIEMNQLHLPSNLVEKFAGICLLDLSAIPSLDEFLHGNFRYPRVDFSRYSQIRQWQITRLPGSRSNDGASDLNISGNANHWMSKQEIEILERLYGGIRNSSPTTKTARQKTLQTLSEHFGRFFNSGMKPTYKTSRVSPSRVSISTRMKKPSNAWFRREMEHTLEVIGKILLWIARFIIDLFFYNRPRQLTQESLKRIGLFVFYAGSTITVVVVVSLVIAWLITVYLP